MTPHPLRGEVWWVDFDPVRGHGQGRTRPALVVSNDIVNSTAAALVTVVPITTKQRALRSFLKIDPPEGGLRQTSFIICDQVRTISKERIGRRFGEVSDGVLREVERRLKFLMDLP